MVHQTLPLMPTYFRLFYGYDVKGDTCGRTNDPLEIAPGSGENLNNKKYVHMYSRGAGKKPFLIVENFLPPNILWWGLGYDFLKMS